MKNFKTTLVAAAVSSMLFGCSGDDYDLPVNENNVAPTVNGDINITVGEKGLFQFVDLLEGTVDADGDFLSVENMDPSIAEIEAMLGVDIDGNQLLLRPSELIDSLNTGDTATMVFTFDVSDGALSTSRMATVNVTGEDFAPEVAEERPLTANFTKDVTVSESTIDALSDVSDADGDVLTTGNLLASDDNPFVLDAMLENNQLVVDVASVAELIPFGQLTEFSFTYDIMDGNNTISRDIEIGILGVSDIAGAPDISNYFPSSNFEEDSGVQTVDLIDDISDEEGDAILVSNVMVDGIADYDVGISVDGTTLSIDTAAFIHHARNGGTGTVKVSYSVSDDQGNQSDGAVEHSIIFSDKNFNLLVDLDEDGNGELDVDYNFERQAAVTDFFGMGVVSEEAARTGGFGLTIDSTESGAQGFAFNIPVLEANKQYYVSLWAKRSSTNADIHYNVRSLASTPSRDWWFGGSRVVSDEADVWEEVYYVIDTRENGALLSGEVGAHWPGLAGQTDSDFTILDGPMNFETRSPTSIDDIRFVDYTAEASEDFDVIANDLGSFDEVNVLPGTDVDGSLEVRPDAGVEGGNGLRVSTDAQNVKVSIPLINTAVRPDGRYRLNMNVNSFEAGAEGTVEYTAYLMTDTGNSIPTSFSQFGNWARDVSVVLNLDESAHTGSPDWVNQDVTLVVEFPNTTVAGDVAGLLYNVDNITLNVAR